MTPDEFEAFVMAHLDPADAVTYVLGNPGRIVLTKCDVGLDLCPPAKPDTATIARLLMNSAPVDRDYAD